jgi:DNA polymerase-3 subunit delta'
MPLRDIQGHRRLIDLLARSIERGTLPPSLIFAGPAPEKRAIAIALAQALNCLAPVESRIPNPESRDACGTCPACTRIARNVHPDVLIVEPGDSRSIKIEQVREAVDRAMYRPFEGRKRVVIVDEADALVDAAQNALLKTLEEPPPSSMFVLVTARPDVLLPTVRSRCIRLTFAAGAASAIDSEARDVAQRALAQLASSRTAAGRLEAAKVLLTGTGRGAPAADDREQVASHLRAMASLLRDVAVIGAKAETATLANADVAPALERLTATFDARRAVEAYGAVDEALEAIDRNAGVKVVADWVVLHV